MSALIRARISSAKTITSCFQKGFSNATTKRLHCQLCIQQKFQQHLLYHGKYSHFQFIRFTQVATAKEEIVPRFTVTLGKLSTKLRHSGMIQYRDFRPCVERFLKEDTIGRQDAALLLRFTGSCLQNADKTQRQELTEQVWSRLKEMNFPFEAIHYNALLLVYAENDYAYDPVNILSEMESNGVQPNRVTYQRLIRQYCISGEVEKALQILEHLKTKGLPVTESVYSSLILGFFKINDLAAAELAYQTILGTDLLPSAETYTFLLAGYAGTDLDKFKQILKEATVDTVAFLPSNYIDISEVLIKAGHKDLIPEVLKSLKITMGSNVAYQSHLIKQFLAAGNEDLANQFANMIPVGKRYPRFELAYGALRDSQQQSPQMKEITPCVKVYEAFSFYHVEKGLELIETRHKEGGLVGDYLFYPAICMYRDRKDKEGIYGVMKQVIAMDMVPKMPQSSVLYRDFFYPAMHKLGETDFDDIVGPLVEMGYDRKLLLEEYVIWLFHDKTIEDAINFVIKWRDEIDLDNGIADTVLLKSHLKFPYELISGLEDFTTEEKQIAFGYCFSQQLASRLQSQVNINALNFLDTKGMKMIVPSKGAVKKKLAKLNPEKFQEIFDKIFDKVVIGDAKMYFDVTTSRKFDIIKFIGKYIDIGPEARFFDALYKKDFQRAEQLIIKTKGIEDIPKTSFGMASLVIINSAIKDLPKAQKYWNMLKDTKTGKSKLHSLSCLYYCNLLLEKGQYEDALNTFQEQAKIPNVFAFDTSAGTNSTIFGIPLRNLTDIAKSIIENIISISDEQQALQLLDGLSVLFIGQRFLRRTFITSLIEKGDSENAKKYFLAFMERYGERYCMRRVLDLLIRDNKLLDVQRVIESNQRHTNSNLNELICAFVSAGDLEKAKELCLVEGMRADNSCLQYACDDFVRSDMVTELENLIAVTKDLREIDRKMLFESAVNLYAKLSDFDKALKMLDQFDEENVIPSAEMLANLAASLQAANKEVPFNIPSEDEVRKEKLLKDKEKEKTLPKKPMELGENITQEQKVQKGSREIRWKSDENKLMKIKRDDFDDFLNDPENEKHCNARLWYALYYGHPKLFPKFEDHIENKASAECKQKIRDAKWGWYYPGDPEKAKTYLEGRNDEPNLFADYLFKRLFKENKADKVADILNDENCKKILLRDSVQYGRIGLMMTYCTQEKVDEALNEYDILVRNNFRISLKGKELLKDLLIKFDRPVPKLFEDPKTTSEGRTVESESRDKTETLENSENSETSDSSDSDSSNEEGTKP